MRRLNTLASKTISKVAAAGRKVFIPCAAAMLVMLSGSLVSAQTRPPAAVPAAVDAKVAERSVSEWLMRMHEASRRRAYVGTFVVLAGGTL